VPSEHLALNPTTHRDRPIGGLFLSQSSFRAPSKASSARVDRKVGTRAAGLDGGIADCCFSTEFSLPESTCFPRSEPIKWRRILQTPPNHALRVLVLSFKNKLCSGKASWQHGAVRTVEGHGQRGMARLVGSTEDPSWFSLRKGVAWIDKQTGVQA
jgi:hypothetical protein